ncbi:MAG: germination protein YpeB [Acetivibrionales bacterium]|nr:germination protein YpeB [Bacillota bacterium]NLP06939.1 germination protein YpeB [Clostridiaceae bacterium]HOA54506.1 germination protein YpeB [Clostridiales bacterium]HPZ04445.1 germination protein YpeB [Clostridiales bacterium]
MGIRDKLLDFKRRLSDRKMYSVVIVLIAAVAAWGIYQYKRAADLRQELDNQYNRAFFEMVSYVNNVESLLAKSMVSTTTDRTAITLQEAWRQAGLAQTNLGQLPVSQPVLASTSKFLTQVSDLSLSLDNQNIRGKSLSKEQQDLLKKLYKYSVSLNKSLQELQDDLNAGRLRWGELANKGTRLFSKTKPGEMMKKIEAVGENFNDYPTLIYDGPFSDHMTTAKARGLTGEEIDAEAARKKAEEFFGKDKTVEVTELGQNDNGPIKTFDFEVKLKDAAEDETVYISVTRKGGHINWMLNNRAVNEEKLDMDKAKAAGIKFLKEKGFDSMEDTYYLKEDNTATINYAYRQDDVTMYPDLIKLKIALDNGEVIGMEAKSYLTNHTERDIPEPSITMEEAREKINSNMKVYSSGLAYIPTEYKKEIFCYEFKGKLDDRDFIVYINALTGEEEDILMIVNTPNGVLTM